MGVSRPAKVIGLGFYLPEKVLTNADLEKMVDTTDEWIRTRTGIKERRIIEENQASSDLGYEAAKRALDDAKLAPSQVDLIIVATISPDMLFPSTACLVQAKIGAKNAAAFDVGAACAGFTYAIAIGDQFIRSGTYHNILLIGVEVLSKFTDWQDRSTCVLLGDGAGAIVLAPSNENGEGVLSSYLGADGDLAELLHMPGGGSLHPATYETIDQRLHYLKMKGNELFKHAVRLMVAAANTVLNQCGLTSRDVAWLIPHQANIRIIEAVAKRLGIPMEKVYLNISRYGNMSSASTATALCEAVKEGKVKKGDIVVLVGFGAGLTWSSCVIKW